jgi:hypothetical protein
MRPYLAFVNLVAIVTPFALLACSGAPASESATAESSALSENCPPGTTWECTNEGPGGKRICQCTPNPTLVVFSGTVSNLKANQTLIIAGQGAYAGQYVMTTDTITLSGPYSFQGQAGENSVEVWAQPAGQTCAAIPVSATNVNFVCF